MIYRTDQLGTVSAGSSQDSRPALFSEAKFAIGQVVRHRIFPFRGVIFDVDPQFANTEEWWLSIPEEVRPRKDQPYYHLLAENEQSSSVAYVAEQNLLPDDTGEPVGHPHTAVLFAGFENGHYRLRPNITH
jgi:heat shock protein HspQ